MSAVIPLVIATTIPVVEETLKSLVLVYLVRKPISPALWTARFTDSQ